MFHFGHHFDGRINIFSFRFGCHADGRINIFLLHFKRRVDDGDKINPLESAKLKVVCWQNQKSRSWHVQMRSLQIKVLSCIYAHGGLTKKAQTNTGCRLRPTLWLGYAGRRNTVESSWALVFLCTIRLQISAFWPYRIPIYLDVSY